MYSWQQYLLTTVDMAMNDILSIHVLPATAGDRIRKLRMMADRVCRDILPEAIALTDAFGWTDWELDR